MCAASSKLRVAIIGGGIAGPALALLLKQELKDCEPVVYESYNAIEEVGAGISLAPNGLRVLDKVGVAHHLVDYVGERLPETHTFRHDGTGIAEIRSKAQEAYGFDMMGFRRHKLRMALLDRMALMGVPLMLGKKLRHLQQEAGGVGPVHVEFEDDSTCEADLVVGCDGLKSKTRALILGTAPPKYLGEEVVFTVCRGRHEDVVPRGRCSLVYGPQGKHFGTYGLRDELSWFTVHRAPESVEAWGLVKDVQQQQERLLEEFRGWHLAETLIGQEVAVMLRLGVYDREPGTTWSVGAVTVAGDAACPIPPNLGQGGNKALEDVGVLTQCLVKYSGQVQPALQLYESIRIKRSMALLDYSRTAALVSSTTNPLVATFRDTALRLLVAIYGTIPSDWMWKYDCDEVVMGP